MSVPLSVIPVQVNIFSVTPSTQIPAQTSLPKLLYYDHKVCCHFGGPNHVFILHGSSSRISHDGAVVPFYSTLHLAPLACFPGSSTHSLCFPFWLPVGFYTLEHPKTWRRVPSLLPRVFLCFLQINDVPVHVFILSIFEPPSDSSHWPGIWPYDFNTVRFSSWFASRVPICSGVTVQVATPPKP